MLWVFCNRSIKSVSDKKIFGFKFLSGINTIIVHA